MCHEKESGEKHKDSGRKGRDLLARGWRDTDGCVCVCVSTQRAARPWQCPQDRSRGAEARPLLIRMSTLWQQLHMAVKSPRLDCLLD